jgi:purine-binding chemotaxis protein CheW
MDFLEIRKKVEERARARAAAQAAGQERAAAAAPAEADPRFTTWRPGAEPPPELLPPEPPLPVPPSDEDFVVVGSGALALAGVNELDSQLAASPPAAPADPLDRFFFRADEAAPGLAIVRAEPEASLEPLAPVGLDEYLTFLLGGDEYAVEIGSVREVVRPPPIAEVPRAPPHIRGVVMVRGDVVAVVDPRERLGIGGQAGAGARRRLVIVDGVDGACGLLVDAVAAVVRLPRGALEPCPQGIAGHRAELLRGIGRTGDRIFTVLDVEALLRRSPPRALPSADARRTDARR